MDSDTSQEPVRVCEGCGAHLTADQRSCPACGGPRSAEAPRRKVGFAILKFAAEFVIITMIVSLACFAYVWLRGDPPADREALEQVALFSVAGGASVALLRAASMALGRHLKRRMAQRVRGSSADRQLDR